MRSHLPKRFFRFRLPPHSRRTVSLKGVDENARSKKVAGLVETGIRDNESAKALAKCLLPGERKLLFDALRKITADQYNEHKRLGNASIHLDDYRSMWYIYFIPNFTVGFLHSWVLIYLSESIMQWGIFSGLSVLGTAGLANIVTNVFVFRLNLGVEKALVFVNIKRPVLSPEQLHNKTLRVLINSAKIIGMLSGSAIGLYPLLFYNIDTEKNREIVTAEMPKVALEPTKD